MGLGLWKQNQRAASSSAHRIYPGWYPAWCPSCPRGLSTGWKPLGLLLVCRSPSPRESLWWHHLGAEPRLVRRPCPLRQLGWQGCEHSNLPPEQEVRGMTNFLLPFKRRARDAIISLQGQEKHGVIPAKLHPLCHEALKNEHLNHTSK